MHEYFSLEAGRIVGVFIAIVMTARGMAPEIYRKNLGDYIILSWFLGFMIWRHDFIMNTYIMVYTGAAMGLVSGLALGGMARATGRGSWMTAMAAFGMIGVAIGYFINEHPLAARNRIKAMALAGRNTKNNQKKIIMERTTKWMNILLLTITTPLILFILGAGMDNIKEMRQTRESTMQMEMKDHIQR